MTDAIRGAAGDGAPNLKSGFGKPASDSTKRIATQPVARSWRQFIKVDPAAETQRSLNEDERRGLEGDLKRHGLREPVVLRILEPGGESRLLDGRHRLDLLEKRGIEVVDADGKLIVEHRVVVIPDDQAAVSQVMSLNFYRRHLDIKERREMIKAMLKSEPTKSDRQIGAIVGFSHPTVAKERKELAAGGDVETVTTSIDSLGRKQPRKRATPRRVGSMEMSRSALQAAWDNAGPLVRAEFLRGLGREVLREALAEIDAADARTDVQRIADRAQARSTAARIDEAAP